MFEGKKKYLIIIFALLISISTVACRVIDQEPKPPIDEEDTIEGPLEHPLDDEGNE